MNEIILRRLTLNNYKKTNDDVTAEVEFIIPSYTYASESTISVKLTDEQTRRIIAAAMESIKDACVSRLENVRADMINVLDMKELAPAPVEEPTEPGPEPVEHILYPASETPEPSAGAGEELPSES